MLLASRKESIRILDFDGAAGLDFGNLAAMDIWFDDLAEAMLVLGYRVQFSRMERSRSTIVDICEDDCKAGRTAKLMLR